MYQKKREKERIPIPEKKIPPRTNQKDKPENNRKKPRPRDTGESEQSQERLMKTRYFSHVIICGRMIKADNDG